MGGLRFLRRLALQWPLCRGAQARAAFSVGALLLGVALLLAMVLQIPVLRPLGGVLAQQASAAASGTSSVTLTNLDASASASVTLVYRTPDGSIAATQTDVLPAGGTKTYSGSSMAVPAGFAGSLTVNADRPVRLLVNQQPVGVAPSSYAGQQSPASTIELPFVPRQQNGWNAALYLQNSGTAPATASVTFYAAGSAVASRTGLRIPAGGQYVLDLAVVSELGNPWSGRAVITSDLPLVAIIYLLDNLHSYFYGGSPRFSDVPLSEPRRAAMELFASAGILSARDDSTFAPGDALTRAAAVAAIVREMNWPLVTPTTPTFSDVPASHWAYSFIETAVRQGVIQGYPDGTFRPDSGISRAGAMRLLVMARGLPLVTPSTPSYSDVPATYWAYSYIETARAYGIDTGYPDGTFRPDTAMTRAEGAADLLATLTLVAPSTPPPTVTPTLTPTPTPTLTPTPVTACPTGFYLAAYFNNRTLTGSPAVVRCEAAPLSYDWGSGSPVAGVGSDNFSVRWTGRFQFDGGTYTFIARADDGVRVWVDGSLVIDAWWDQPPTEYRASSTLAGGEHEVKMEYYENGGGAVAQLRWEQLATPTFTPTATATLVATNTPVATATSTRTPTPAPTATATPAPASPTPTSTVSAPSPTATAAVSATSTATSTPGSFQQLPAPTDLQAWARRGSIVLNWDSVGSKLRYNVYRSTAPGSYSSTPYAANVWGSRYIDSNVQSGVTYYYVVTATDGTRESARSNEASARAR